MIVLISSETWEILMLIDLIAHPRSDFSINAKFACRDLNNIEIQILTHIWILVPIYHFYTLTGS